MGEVEALQLVAAQQAQQLGLLLGLHPSATTVRSRPWASVMIAWMIIMLSELSAITPTKERSILSAWTGRRAR